MEKLLAPLCSALFAGAATALLLRDGKPAMASDVEYLLRRAQAVQQQQQQQPPSEKDRSAAGPQKRGNGRKSRSAAKSASGTVVTLDHLVVAMKETGAAVKVASSVTDGNKSASRPGTVAPTATETAQPAAPAEQLPPGPVTATQSSQQPAEPQALTKKELEETMKQMLMPPGAQGFGADGESALDRFTQDLTQSARMGKLDPVIGRDDEIRRCVHILSRRTKNNPVLIGESGVGKTALVEGLAQRIVAGDVPQSLQGVKILELDLGALTAGCMMPGEFEERLKAVLNEVQALRGRAVLFIDDIHNLVPAPGTGGATMMDGGSLLKPALSRGQLRCIGASSVDKFKKTIEKDPGLERRFQQVLVEQPSVAQTISILRGLRQRYENYHGIDISEGALMAAASLSARYINGRFLPDKAIDLMDESTAQVKMEATVKPEAQDSLERRLKQLDMEEASLSKRPQGDRTAAACLAEIRAARKTASEALEALKQQYQQQREAEEREEKEANGARNDEAERKSKELQNRVTRLTQLSQQAEELEAHAAEAEAEGDEEAAEQAYEQAKALRGEMQDIRMMMMMQQGPMGGFPHAMAHWGMKPPKRQEVTEADVAKVISRWTGIPVAKLVAGEREKLLALTDELHRRIIGQNEAVEAVAEAVQRSRADLADPNGPIASFMFLGPTGVGKTELAKALAAYLFNSEDALVRLDMSEYMEKHAVSRLIGAPPGYVGYDEGGLLTDAVRRRPYSVVLFDEIEKAHVDVFNVLLQILDDGRVTDTQGHTVSFKNTVIIMTSNLGSSEIFDQLGNKASNNTQQPADGKAAVDGTTTATENGNGVMSHEERRLAVKEKVMEHVRTHFRPEFLNRVDDFITFEPLQPDQIKQIVILRAQKLVNRLAERRMKLELTDSAVEHLACVGFDPVFGARPVKRALQRELQTLLAKAVLRGEYEEDDTIIVEAVGHNGIEAGLPRHGDGNYRSGLVLKKGPKLVHDTDANSSKNTPSEDVTPEPAAAKESTQGVQQNGELPNGGVVSKMMATLSKPAAQNGHPTEGPVTGHKANGDLLANGDESD